MPLKFRSSRIRKGVTVTDIPRGKYIGKRIGQPATDEAEHFIRCPACGGWIDCRDLGQALEHYGPLPHRRWICHSDREKPRYESRVFDGRIIHSAEIERIHEEVLDFERIARANRAHSDAPSAMLLSR
jgi:hypothetical protein